MNLLDRRSRLLVEHIDDFYSAIHITQQRFPFEIDALVVLPDHLHAVLTLPQSDTDFPLRWRQIKSRFSKCQPKVEPRSAVRTARGARGIWQDRYWEHLIRDERDWHHHVDYYWFNPVKHGLTQNIEDWPYSTFHRDMCGMEHPYKADSARMSFVASGYGERDCRAQ